MYDKNRKINIIGEKKRIQIVKKFSKSCPKVVQKLSKSCPKVVQKLSKSCPKVVK
jgi:hypothetical protein